MSVLTKNEILKALERNELAFNPPIDAFQLQPHAVDLRLGTTFYIAKSWALTEQGREALNVDYLNIKENKESFEIVELKPGQFFEILPGEFIIASTLEKVSLHNLQLMAILYPRSSFNRRGLSVNLSGIIDTGYSGHLMIPIQNNTMTQVVKIYPGERVCQIVFEELKSKLTREEAMQHGVSKGKYFDADDKNLSYKVDKHEEIEFIKKGKLNELKTKYNINDIKNSK